MERSLPEGEVLLRMRRDRRELLAFLLAPSPSKIILMPPGAVSVEDVDLDIVSANHVLHWCRNGGVLDLALAMKQYQSEISLPLQGLGSTGDTSKPLDVIEEVRTEGNQEQTDEKGEDYELATTPDVSGPPPGRPPPSPKVNGSMSPPVAPTIQYTSSGKPPTPRSNRVQQYEEYEESNGSDADAYKAASDAYNPFDEDDGEVTDAAVQKQPAEQQQEKVMLQTPVEHPRGLTDGTTLSLALPPLATGLLDENLREAAYELLLASVGAAGGLALKEAPKDSEKPVSLLKRFGKKVGSPQHSSGSSTTGGRSESSQRAPGLAGLMAAMRVQMHISEDMDARTRGALLEASQQRAGRRLDNMLVPLELLAFTRSSSFKDHRSYVRWAKQKLNILEEGLVNLPQVRLDAYNSLVAQFKTISAKLQDAQYKGVASDQAEVMKMMRQVASSLADRSGQGEFGAEGMCHWADGYHFNVRLYQQLLESCFDIHNEGHFVKEVEEIQELLKSTWRNLGITPTIHDIVNTWVIFHKYVSTGEEALLPAALAQLRKISLSSQLSPQEQQYLRLLHCVVDTPAGPRDFSLLQSVLVPIREWIEKRLRDYHATVPVGGKATMDSLVWSAVLCSQLLADEDVPTPDGARLGRPDRVVQARQCEDYIKASISAAFQRAWQSVNAGGEAAESPELPPLALQANQVQSLMQREIADFSPALSRWNPAAMAIAASVLHFLYAQELRPFLDQVTMLTDEVEQVLPAADNLDQMLCDSAAGVADEALAAAIREKMVSYEVTTVSGALIMRWVNSQLAKMNEWVDRTVFSETWEPISKVQRHGASIMDVFRIVEETVDQFFGLTLPMRMNLLKGLATGIDSALQQYANRIVAQLGPKEDLVAPVAQLTRYKKDVAAKAALGAAKRAQEPPLTDEERVAEISALTTTRLCVRLNTLQFVLAHVDQLEDSIRERWATKRPQDEAVLRASVQRRRAGDGGARRGPPTRGDELITAFDPSRRLVSLAIDKICDYTGTKVVFWDLREPFLEGLYRVSVSVARMDRIVSLLDPVLGELCEVIAEPLRDRVVLGLLQASLDGLLRVLLDGGSMRVFAKADADMLEEDLATLKDFFIADGDGLPRAVVEATAAPVAQILNLYALETSIVVESFRKANEVTHTNVTSSGSIRSRNVMDSDTLLRVLCHRADREASKFLKKVYKLPKTTP